LKTSKDYNLFPLHNYRGNRWKKSNQNYITIKIRKDMIRDFYFFVLLPNWWKLINFNDKKNEKYMSYLTAHSELNRIVALRSSSHSNK